ncbi:MAG TPA: hypothetical protein VM077_01125 [Candidatus Limnocylindrales bacterium]|nr:hypothetical protein [Candidatus Limnocylindrales bacterium]
MAKQECGYGSFCGKREKCFLQGTTERQANLGGNPSEADSKVTSRGPYWTRSAWGEFTGRVIKMASSEGCLFKDEVPRVVAQITEGKEKKGEFK